MSSQGNESSPDERSRLRGRKKKIPTRRHLIQKLDHANHKLAEAMIYMESHRKHCSDCWFCRDNAAFKWHSRDRKNILREMDKYGYKHP